MGWFDGPEEKKEVKLLSRLLEIAEQDSDMQRYICRQLKCIDDRLAVIEARTTPAITGFNITQQGESNMGTTPPVTGLTPPDPGNTLVFTATPTPAGATLPTGVIPVWTSSDPTNAPVTADVTGLIGTVVLGTAIPVGESVTLTVTATLLDGTTPTGSVSFTVGALPPVEVTGFTVVQTT